MNTLLFSPVFCVILILKMVAVKGMLLKIKIYSGKIRFQKSRRRLMVYAPESFLQITDLQLWGATC